MSRAADTAQSRKRSNVTRPFPSRGGVWAQDYPRPACSLFCAGRMCSWGKLSTKEFARWPNLSYHNCTAMHWQSDEDYRKLCRYTYTFIQSAPSAWRQSLLNYFHQKAITTTLLANIGLAHIDLTFASCKYE